MNVYAFHASYEYESSCGNERGSREVPMSEVVEAIRAAGLLIFMGIIFVIFGQAIADAPVNTNPVDLGLIGMFAIFGGGIIIIGVVVVVIRALLDMI